MINEFSIKACKSKLEELGYKNLDYFSHRLEDCEGIGYFFKVDIYGYSFYFSDYDKQGSNRGAYEVIVDKIESILKDYKNNDLDKKNFKYFIVNTAICKFCFEEKSNHSFPILLLNNFYKLCIEEHKSCKEFIQNLDNYDLANELRPTKI